MGEIFCDYNTGMLTLQPRDENDHGLSAHYSEIQATAYHEAGHAVVQYALGWGIRDIGMRTRIVHDKDNEKGITYSGVCYVTHSCNARVNQALRRGQFCWDLLVLGIKAAAGPAAERKYCLSDDVPVRTRLTSEGDREQIDYAAFRLLRNGRNPDAFRRLVWRQAQLILEDQIIWQTVSELAVNLQNFWPHENELGDYEEILDGRTARAWIQDSGVRAGMLRPKKHRVAREA